MTSVAVTLAEWAAGLEPGREDLELAHRSLLDTLAVTLAARGHRVTRLAAGLPEGARWAVAGHVLDFDDLHMPSTTHVSVVAAAAALLDEYAGFGSFTDAAVRRDEARRLVGLDTDPGSWTWDNAATTLRRYLP